MNLVSKHQDWRLPVLLSIAKSIEIQFPSAASEIRGIVKSMEPPIREQSSYSEEANE